MRTITTPVFTSGRLKGMVPIMHRISVQLKEVTGEMAKEKQLVQLKPLFADLAFETIMSTGFGIEVNAWRDKDNIVKKMARTYLGYEGGAMLMIKFMIIFTMPWMAEKMKMKMFDGKAEDFFGKEHALKKATFDKFLCHNIVKNTIISLNSPLGHKLIIVL